MTKAGKNTFRIYLVIVVFVLALNFIVDLMESARITTLEKQVEVHDE